MAWASTISSSLCVPAATVAGAGCCCGPTGRVSHLDQRNATGGWVDTVSMDWSITSWESIGIITGIVAAIFGVLAAVDGLTASARDRRFAEFLRDEIKDEAGSPRAAALISLRRSLVARLIARDAVPSWVLLAVCTGGVMSNGYLMAATLASPPDERNLLAVAGSVVNVLLGLTLVAAAAARTRIRKAYLAGSRVKLVMRLSSGQELIRGLLLGAGVSVPLNLASLNPDPAPPTVDWSRWGPLAIFVIGVGCVIFAHAILRDRHWAHPPIPDDDKLGANHVEQPAEVVDTSTTKPAEPTTS